MGVHSRRPLWQQWLAEIAAAASRWRVAADLHAAGYDRVAQTRRIMALKTELADTRAAFAAAKATIVTLEARCRILAEEAVIRDEFFALVEKGRD